MSSGRSKSRRRFTVDALFEDTSPRASGVRDLLDAKEINIDRIVPDPEQPRQTFDQGALEELAASIRQEGILQPIAVRYDESEDRYVILHGERRWRAAQIANLNSIPAIVRDVPAERRLLHQLMENVVREDLNAVDRAAALRALKRQMDDAPWERVAEAVGIRRSRLFQLLSTEKLAEPVQELIRSGQLSEKQTRSLQGLPPEAQEMLAGLLVSGEATEQSIRQVSRRLREDPTCLELDGNDLVTRIRELHEKAGEPETPSRTKRDPLVTALRDLFGTRFPNEPARALEEAQGSIGSGTAATSELTADLQRVGYELGRIASADGSGEASNVPAKQLRALKRLIDLALEAQRGR
jgi:ParB family transcriptional regulator, chromosome partitioning protein